MRCLSPFTRLARAAHSSLQICPAHRNFRLADCVTLGNGFCGALSLFSSAEYLRTNEQRFLWCAPPRSRLVRCSSTGLRAESRNPLRRALAFPLLGMIFDALDGKVARWRRESSMLGQELDSLADSVR